jgi:hypothetical protein
MQDPFRQKIDRRVERLGSDIENIRRQLEKQSRQQQEDAIERQLQGRLEQTEQENKSLKKRLSFEQSPDKNSSAMQLQKEAMPSSVSSSLIEPQKDITLNLRDRHVKELPTHSSAAEEPGNSEAIGEDSDSFDISKIIRVIGSLLQSRSQWMQNFHTLVAARKGNYPSSKIKKTKQ